MRAIRKNVPEMAPALVRKNQAESGRIVLTAPKKSWGSIKGNMGNQWWGTCPNHTWQGRGDASYPSSAQLGSWGNAGNAETSAKQLGIAAHCTSVSPAAINFKIKKLNLNILKKKSQRHGWYHFVDQRYFIGWLVPTILPLQLMLLTSVEV